MTDRQTVAVRDDSGNLRWFPVDDAQRWPGTTLNGGDLYRVAGQWVLMPPLAELLGEPARLIDEDEALTWLATNGYRPDGLDELTDCAARRRLR